jgi:hypothetical protein
MWRVAIDTSGAEGTLSLHTLSGDTLYATTHIGIYAINARDGQIRWLYQPKEQSIVSGPPVVAARPRERSPARTSRSLASDGIISSTSPSAAPSGTAAFVSKT